MPLGFIADILKLKKFFKIVLKKTTEQLTKEVVNYEFIYLWINMTESYIVISCFKII
jgi:hypothetical protein